MKRLALASLVIAAALSPTSNAATFPGANGKIAFERFVGGDAEVFVMDSDGQNQTNLTDNTTNDFVPEFSADGERIVFQSVRDGDSDIYAMGASGQDVVQVTNDPGDDVEPSFSPDGSKIAFSSERDGDREIFVMNADGTNPVQLTFNAQFEADPTFSPDGTRIAFTSERDGDAEIFSMGPNGENQTQLTQNAFEDREPNFSPDGLPQPNSLQSAPRITFSSDRDGDLEIIVMDVSGQNQTQITSNTTADREPAFSADGTLILFRKIDAGAEQVWQMDPSGQNQSPLTNGTDDESPSSQPLNPPAITIAAGKKQTSPRGVTITVESLTENATATVDGTLRVPKRKPKAGASKKKTVGLEAATVQLQTRVAMIVTLPVAGTGKKLIKKALKAGKRPKGTITATATDDLGTSASASVAV